MKIEILKLEENGDGTCKLEYSYDDEYYEAARKKLGKSSLTEEEMCEFVTSEIQKAIDEAAKSEE